MAPVTTTADRDRESSTCILHHFPSYTSLRIGQIAVNGHGRALAGVGFNRNTSTVKCPARDVRRSSSALVDNAQFVCRAVQRPQRAGFQQLVCCLPPPINNMHHRQFI